MKFANQNATLGYTLGGWADRYLVSAMIGYSHADRYFSSQSILLQNYSVSELVVLSDRNSLFTHVSADY